jgi:hypothetical protein
MTYHQEKERVNDYDTKPDVGEVDQMALVLYWK